MIGKQEGEEGELAAAPVEELLGAELVERGSLVVAPRSARGRSPRASAAAPRAPRARCPRPAPRPVSSWSTFVGSCVSTTTSWPFSPVADLGRDPRAGQLRRLAERDDPALAQHGDAIGELLRLVEVVRRQEDGLAELAQRADHLPRGAAGRRVEAGRRLVEEEELGVADQAERRGRADAAGRPRASSRARRASPRARRAR